jgi:hypothetical protein
MTTVRRTFEAAGVEFIDENGGGPGVRLRKAQLAEQQRRLSIPTTEGKSE